MNDFVNLEKTIVRELSCRLCLCTDVTKLVSLNTEIRRKIKKLFSVVIQREDKLPKAICHDCLQQLSQIYLFSVKVDKTQKLLELHKSKSEETKYKIPDTPLIEKTSPIRETIIDKPVISSFNNQKGDFKHKHKRKKDHDSEQYLEAMPLDEFAVEERLDKKMLIQNSTQKMEENQQTIINKIEPKDTDQDSPTTVLDPIVLIDGRPARQGTALDKQITQFYKMECCICHEKAFQFKTLMKHYKERHGVPGYVTCCDKKFHYFYPKKIIEHMAYHLQPTIFTCRSCHTQFQTSNELYDHHRNGGKAAGKIICPKCSDNYPTYRELGRHLVTHRAGERNHCDYCFKTLRFHHKKKTVNNMEDLILCAHCLRSLKHIEKQQRHTKEKLKGKNDNVVTLKKYQKFKQALQMSAEDDESTE